MSLSPFSGYTVTVRQTIDELVAEAANLLISQVREASRFSKGASKFSIGLSGGSTPRVLYETLARRQSELDWRAIHLFWGDERCVPPDHPDSNYRMAYESLIQHVPIPPENVHRMRGEDDPQAAAEAYGTELHAVLGERPEFDLLLLGLGDDAHTASLFPGTAAIHESQKPVIAHYVEKLNAWRMTITPAIINATPKIIFLVVGSSKAEALKQVIEGEYQPDEYPAQIVKPTFGLVYWFVDAPAASLLEKTPNEPR